MAINNKLRVLHIVTDQISIIDIPRVLDELGYDVYNANLGIRAVGYHKADSKKIMLAIEEFGIQCITSYDFSESIAAACMEKGIPYIAWVYDAPQKELYTHYALYSCNYIFVFDRMQQKRLRDIGIKNVYFMPLAIHAEKIKRELMIKPKAYACDVAFVGQLYNVENTEYIVEQAPDYVKENIHHCIEQCIMQWNDDILLHGSMSKESAEYFDGLETIPIEKRYPYITKEFYYEAAVLSRMIAHRERIHSLNILAEKYHVDFYTFDADVSMLSDKVNIMPGVKQDGGISCVYRDAKINLNITLHCIETGVCQRVFDVMAAGGFLLSNYQKELEDLFEVGKEIVLFHNEEEMLQLVEYYLTHDEEREEIARNGQRKVLSCHDYHGRFQRIMEIINNEEKNRKESYIDIQRKILIKKANDALACGSEKDICDLIELYNNPIYDLATQEETDLGRIKEMLFVWEQERSIKGGNIFNNINNIKEAELLYLRTKHILLRIENNCDYSVCLEGVNELLERGVSCAFMAWLIKSKMSERSETYLKLSDYLWNINPNRGIEMITYGLFDFPGDTELLLYKANYLLELQCYKEALETLRKIQDPNKEIRNIILKLEAAFAGQ